MTIRGKVSIKNGRTWVRVDDEIGSTYFYYSPGPLGFPSLDVVLDDARAHVQAARDDAEKGDK